MDGGAQPKPSDADTADAGTPSEAPPPQPAAEKEKTEDITWTLFDEGRFIRYDISGKIFELTSKYKPPIKKIPNAFADKITAKRTLREIKLLLNLHHENVVGVKDIIPPPLWDFNDVYIAYELMDTDLHHIIHSNQQLSKEHYQGGHGFFLCHWGGVVLACDFIGGDYSCHEEGIVPAGVTYFAMLLTLLLPDSRKRDGYSIEIFWKN